MRFPGLSDRISIVGRTGTGKTVVAAFHVLQLPFEDIPILVYDFKGDELIADISAHEQAHVIGVEDFPDGPGIYVVRPLPDDEEQVEEQLWRIWHNGWMGLYIDEGYMVTGSPAYRAILQQGRSKKIPAITLSQRPVWMDVFSFSEASFYHVLALNNKGDRQKMMEYIPADISKPLPAYHGYYYDVADDRLEVVKPVPPPAELVKRFHARMDAMKPKRRVNVL